MSEYENEVMRVKAALGGASDGTGGKFLPDETASEIIELVYERSVMRQALTTMPMSRDTVKVPKLTGSVSFYGHTAGEVEAGTGGTESVHASGEIVLTMKTLIANIPIGNRVIAYGVDGLMQVLRTDIASRLAFNEEEMFLNGDDTATTAYADNINGAWHAANNTTGVDGTHNTYLLQFQGLRKKAGVSVDCGGNAFEAADVRSAISSLGLHASNRDELVLMVPRNVEADMLGWTELQTVDKYGPSATILRGEIGKVYGITVVATSALPNGTLNATGVNPGDGTGTLSCALLFNTTSPIIGNPSNSARRFSVGFLDEPKADRFVLIPRQDLAFNVRHTEAVCLLFNIL